MLLHTAADLFVCCTTQVRATGSVVQARPKLDLHTEEQDSSEALEEDSHPSSAEAIERASAVAAQAPVAWPPSSAPCTALAFAGADRHHLLLQHTLCRACAGA